MTESNNTYALIDLTRTVVRRVRGKEDDDDDDVRGDTVHRHHTSFDYYSSSFAFSCLQSIECLALMERERENCIRVQTTSQRLGTRVSLGSLCSGRETEGEKERKKMNQIRKHNNFESRKRITMSMIKHVAWRESILSFSLCLCLIRVKLSSSLLLLCTPPEENCKLVERERARARPRRKLPHRNKSVPTVSSGSDVKSSKFVNVKAWNEINQTPSNHQSSPTPTLILVDVVE